ncbi:McbB family protein [Pseudomonas cichorii]|uniref:McbB family protein n=1 Tax=Pseudomonas cichorii TaxID=36746 RepID=UPI001C8AE439|nr:McbB family protein [Pseudomonas cichorii]MBX8486540.1 McbB family protein [Pseudomonas cichorii]MBX8496644.1 McbB family protein [Pseudomonas cichorii]MBX8513938.1 McbB family protein [Pseudomonas cichorii]MBX8576115.1 McbB family protein [Pseudomonas cichorii]
MLLKIFNYEMLNFENQKLIISEKGISKINSDPLWSVLRELQESQERTITEATLDELINKNNLPHPDTRNFLNTALNIQNHLKNPYIEEVLIIHNLSSATSLEKILSEEVTRKCTIIPISKLNTERLKNKRAFVHFFCEPYDYHALHDKFFEIAEKSPQAALCVSYFTADSFCVSQPFIPETGSPCHFCAIDRISSYEDYTSSNNSWTKLLRFCKKNNIPAPSKEPSLLQRSLAYGLLAQRINFYTTQHMGRRHQDSVFSSVNINLHNGKITEETVPHWFLCKCLRDKK